MPNTAMSERVRRQMLVGRVSKLFNAGYSTEEIQAELKLSESQVRPLIKICEDAKKKRAEMEADNNVAD